MTPVSRTGRRSLAGLAALFVSWSSSVLAQEPPAVPGPGDVTAYDLEALLSTAVESSTKTALKASEAPNVVSVVPREQLDAYAWLTLNDILYKQPGFAPSRDYERRTVSGRGQFESWNNNHLLLLVDGVPFNDNETGGAFTWDNTPLFMVKSIEIIRGPGSALYGSSATNGVIALNTLSADDLGGAHAMARLRIGNADTNAYEGMAAASLPLASAVVGFSASRTSGDEY